MSPTSPRSPVLALPADFFWDELVVTGRVKTGLGEGSSVGLILKVQPGRVGQRVLVLQEC